MDSAPLRIQMLGEFSISAGRQTLRSTDSRSRKVWLLLAYMICCRNRLVTQDELIAQLWGDEEKSTNPGNALKTMFHRLRTMLCQLEGFSGYDLIIRQSGSYAWNNEIPVSLDTEEFESLCRAAETAADAESKVEWYLQALDQYEGDYLPQYATETWVIPTAAYYHNLYLQALEYTLPALEEAGRFREAAKICRRAVEIEPYNEALYCHLMRELIKTGDQQGAVAVYESVCDMLFTDFGVMPSDELRSLYHEAVHSVNRQAVSILDVQEQLREPDLINGALYCDYDFFKVLYHAKARGLMRSGDAIHICLLSVENEKGGELPRRSLDRCMDNLQDLICECLRKGDVVSRCSLSQYVMLLPQANYENSCKVCDRIVKAFYRRYPHSPAKLRYSVQPLKPST